jgi:hypothetical protein
MDSHYLSSELGRLVDELDDRPASVLRDRGLAPGD